MEYPWSIGWKQIRIFAVYTLIIIHSHCEACRQPYIPCLGGTICILPFDSCTAPRYVNVTDLCDRWFERKLVCPDGTCIDHVKEACTDGCIYVHNHFCNGECVSTPERCPSRKTTTTTTTTTTRAPNRLNPGKPRPTDIVMNDDEIHPTSRSSDGIHLNWFWVLPVIFLSVTVGIICYTYRRSKNTNGNAVPAATNYAGMVPAEEGTYRSQTGRNSPRLLPAPHNLSGIVYDEGTSVLPETSSTLRAPDLTLPPPSYEEVMSRNYQMHS